MKRFSCLTMLFATVLFSFTTKNNTLAVKDYLSVPGPIELNKTSYSLSWSAHPSATFYTQEYLPATQKSDTYTNMVMVQTLAGELTAQQAMRKKEAELQERKKDDAVADYTIIENKSTGQFMIEFVLSQGTGKQRIVEWNVYRYMSLKEKEGTNGILLFAYSRRGYGDGGTAFLKSLKVQKQSDINAVSAYPFPQIKIKAN